MRSMLRIAACTAFVVSALTFGSGAASAQPLAKGPAAKGPTAAGAVPAVTGAVTVAVTGAVADLLGGLPKMFREPEWS
ncbi:hypothetical protein ACFWNK_13765 [Streptomyces sp. NPDC058417]|uniref:hypothetical protein n=1 Tax=unclassified Streptomyces TaxID=2593676 RepID=UPI0036600731